MRSSLPLLSLACLALATHASAQCLDPNLGTLVGTGDDVVLPIQSIGFAFPFGGATYTDCHINTNGSVFLSNAGVPALPAYTILDTSAELLANTVIAISGQDLVANAPGGCYLNQLGTHTTITWDQVYEYGMSSAVFSIQLALYPNGDFSLAYGPGANQVYTSGSSIVGCCVGGTPADPGAADLSSYPVLGTTFYETFNSGTLPFDIGNATQYFTATGTGYAMSTPCLPASSNAYGDGCVQQPIVFYEHFPTSTGDLDLTTLILTQNALGGYDSVAVPLTTFNAPTSTSLGLGDESTAILTLPFTFDFPGGSTTDLTVTSNGRLFLNANGSTDYSNSTSELVAALDPILFPAWFDLQLDPLSADNVYFDVISATEVNITFLDCPRFPATYGDTETFQVAIFDNGTNDYVEIRYDHLMNDGFRGVHVGFTPGGATLDPGSSDLTAGVVSTAGSELPALMLSTDVAPVLGNTVTFTVDNIRSLGMGGLSVIWGSFGQTAPTPLTTLGVNSPGCYGHIDMGSMVTFSTPLLATPTDTFSYTVPSAAFLAGLNLYFQAGSLSPGETPSGVLTSNGIHSHWEAF